RRYRSWCGPSPLRVAAAQRIGYASLSHRFQEPSPMLTQLTGPSRPPLSGGKSSRLVILLHGLGADGNDLIGLQQYWGRLVPDAEFISPNAPFPCDMAPYGYEWSELHERTPQTRAAGGR